MHSMRKRFKQWLLCLLVLGLLIPQKVHAIEKIDEERPVSLRIEFHGEEEYLEGTNVWIYKVANVSGYGEFELTGDFKDYPVKVNGLDAEGFRLLAETLEMYVLKDKILSTDSTEVVDGVAVFPARQEKLEQGLYLVICQNYKSELENYTYTPILICLPNRDENDVWIYDETIYPKDAPEDEKTEIEVVKKWKNNGEKQPIKVELINGDGEVCDTVVLNEENSWRHKWTLLEKDDWKVNEKDVPEGYTVTISKEQNGYVIINTPDTPNTPNTPPKPSGKLPQTGVLWWPVPILAGAGMVFFMIGWIKRHRFEE